jgi:hypothetical protein
MTKRDFLQKFSSQAKNLDTNTFKRYITDNNRNNGTNERVSKIVIGTGISHENVFLAR